MRTNAGFEIVAAVPVVKNLEVVIGFRETSLGDSYVCWYCQNGEDYYWGNYSHKYKDALRNMISRLKEYLE